MIVNHNVMVWVVGLLLSMLPSIPIGTALRLLRNNGALSDLEETLYAVLTGVIFGLIGGVYILLNSE